MEDIGSVTQENLLRLHRILFLIQAINLRRTGSICDAASFQDTSCGKSGRRSLVQFAFALSSASSRVCLVRGISKYVIKLALYDDDTSLQGLRKNGIRHIIKKPMDKFPTAKSVWIAHPVSQKVADCGCLPPSTCDGLG
jgi:hypothetical protein